MVTQKEYNLSQYFMKYLYDRFLKQDDRHYIDILSGNSNLTYSHLFAVVAKSDLPIDIVKKIMEYSYYRLRPWCGIYLFEPEKEMDLLSFAPLQAMCHVLLQYDLAF